DNVCTRHTQQDGGILLQNPYSRLDETWRKDVVVVRPFEILAAAQTEESVEVGCDAKVAFIAVEAYAVVATRIIGADFERVVVRVIVADNELEIAVGLCQNRFDRLGYITATVEKDRKSTRLNSSHVKISY